MIDPVIFSTQIFGFTLALRWYGLIVMTGVIVGSLIVERELKRRGENGDRIWDALILVLPAGIIGARLWYVMNATLGGDARYANNPVEILKIWNGGLHIFGGFLFGAVALLLYLRQNKLDPWLFLDAAGPAVLIGQGIGRIGNFINQELYGPPTSLPWGIRLFPDHPYQIPIEMENRSAQELIAYLETTRFHPTFAYEMLWNFAAGGLLLWLSRRFEKDLKPGTIFSGWLLIAGLGRVLIEFFRPDQPKIAGLGISYTSIVAALMAIGGAVMLMARYKAINPSFAENWEEEYQIAGQLKSQVVAAEETPDITPARKSVSSNKRVAAKKSPRKPAARKTTKSTK
jgi:phosphatidylglycerol:prolipoprotein diacylglycerol transferase